MEHDVMTADQIEGLLRNDADRLTRGAQSLAEARRLFTSATRREARTGGLIGSAEAAHAPRGNTWVGRSAALSGTTPAPSA
jgi:hypothetical protein